MAVDGGFSGSGSVLTKAPLYPRLTHQPLLTGVLCHWSASGDGDGCSATPRSGACSSACPPESPIPGKLQSPTTLGSEIMGGKPCHRGRPLCRHGRGPITIGSQCWIASGVFVAPVTIGAVVGGPPGERSSQ